MTDIFKLRVVVFIFIICLAGTASAFTVAEANETDLVHIDTTDLVQLSPADGPNGAYTTVIDGDLAIVFDRLNENAVTQADDIFTITSVAEQPIAVGISHDADDVTFYEGSDRTKTLDDGGTTELSPGDSLSVGLLADSTGDVDLDQITVYVHLDDEQQSTDSTVSPTPAPEFEVRNTSVEPRTVQPGEMTTLSMEIANVGDATGNYTAELTVDGVVVETQTVLIEPGETRTIIFERSYLHAGEHTLSINGTSGVIDFGTTTVVESDDGPRFTITDVVVSDTEISTGDETVISALITNEGSESETITVELTIGGIVVDTQTISIPAGSTVDISFTHTFDETGTYSVAVAGVAADSVTVGETVLETISNRSLTSSTSTALAPFLIGGILLLTWIDRRFR